LKTTIDRFISCIYFMVCPAFLWHFRQTSLRASGGDSLFLMAFMFALNKLTCSPWTRNWCVPFSSNHSLFSYTFLTANLKVKVKYTGNDASHNDILHFFSRGSTVLEGPWPPHI
jgi:hypothetical protein